MDLESVPSGKDSPLLKSPVVQVDTVDLDPAELEAINEEKQMSVEPEVSHSELESNDDGSGDEWEAESLYEDAIQMLRDEQLRDGGISSPFRLVFT